jgi:hypothetical protein
MSNKLKIAALVLVVVVVLAALFPLAINSFKACDFGPCEPSSMTR